MADIYDEGTYRKPNVPRNKQTNTLLVRAPVGQVRPSTHTLPPENFAYGRSDRPADDQGVGMCVGNWKTHLGSKPSSATAAAASKTAAVRNQAHVTVKGVDPNMTHGRPSKPSTPINNVMANEYQRQWIASTQSLQNANSTANGATAAFSGDTTARGSTTRAAGATAASSGGFRAPQPTKASQGHYKPRNQPPPPEPFKMARFKDVPSRVRIVNTYGPQAACVGGDAGTETMAAAEGEQGQSMEI